MRSHDGHELSVAAVSGRNTGIAAAHIQGTLLRLGCAGDVTAAGPLVLRVVLDHAVYVTEEVEREPPRRPSMGAAVA